MVWRPCGYSVSYLLEALARPFAAVDFSPGGIELVRFGCILKHTTDCICADPRALDEGVLFGGSSWLQLHSYVYAVGLMLALERRLQLELAIWSLSLLLLSVLGR